MSQLPDNDPVLGDKHSCRAIETVIVPRTRDLGGPLGTKGFGASVAAWLAANGMQPAGTAG